MKAFLLSTLLILSAAACGGDSLSRDEANRAYGSTASALTNAQATAQVSATDGTVSATADCDGGGTLAIDGSWNSSADLSLSVTMNNCTEQGITMDGAVQLDAGADITGATLEIHGQLSFSGAVNASCDVDAVANAGIGGALLDASVCGQSVSVSVTP